MLLSPSSKIPSLLEHLGQELLLHLDFDNPLHACGIALVDPIERPGLSHQALEVVVLSVGEHVGSFLALFRFGLEQQVQWNPNRNRSGDRFSFRRFSRVLHLSRELAKKLGVFLENTFFCSCLLSLQFPLLTKIYQPLLTDSPN
jgi:hypothetical protein